MAPVVRHFHPSLTFASRTSPVRISTRVRYSIARKCKTKVEATDTDKQSSRYGIIYDRNFFSVHRNVHFDVVPQKFKEQRGV